MAAVTILRAPVCGDTAKETPRKQWPLLIGERQNFCRKIFPRDCRMLLFFIEDGAASDWMGFGNREVYLRDGLQLDPATVDLAMRGLKLTDPNKAVGMDEAIVLGKRGRPKKGEEKGAGTLK